MAAAFGIEVSKCRNPAPAKGEICRVGVLEACGGRSEVECGRGPYTVFEGAVGVPILLEKGLEVVGVVVVKPGGPICEGSGGKAGQADERGVGGQRFQDAVVGAMAQIPRLELAASMRNTRSKRREAPAAVVPLFR